MRRMTVRMAVCLAILGCSEAESPEFPRLAEAGEVRVFRETGEPIEVRPPDSQPFRKGSEAWVLPYAEVGCRAIVLSDQGPEGSADRRVIAKLLDGRLSGTVCAVPRENLRPLK